MSNTLGVSSIKAAALIAVGLITKSISSFADGVQGSDFLGFLPDVMSAATNTGVFKNIGPEIQDGISEAEATELKDAIKNAFVDAKLGIEKEAFIDNLCATVLDAVISNLRIVYLVKVYKAAA